MAIMEALKDICEKYKDDKQLLEFIHLQYIHKNRLKDYCELLKIQLNGEKAKNNHLLKKIEELGDSLRHKTNMLSYVYQLITHYNYHGLKSIKQLKEKYRLWRKEHNYCNF